MSRSSSSDTLSNSLSLLAMSQTSDSGGSESQDGSGSSSGPLDSTKGRRLRHSYRNVIDKQLDEEEQSPPDDALLTVRDLFDDVNQAPEAVLDSAVVRMAISSGRQLATSLPVTKRKFHPEEFAARVREFVSETSLADPLTENAWAELGKLAEGTMKTSYPFWYVYGSADDAPVRTREAPVRRMVQDAPDRALTVPKQVEMTSTRP